MLIFFRELEEVGLECAEDPGAGRADRAELTGDTEGELSSPVF